MPNRLQNETSPYLLQHAHNPVDWYPWGAEALEKARREDKPIFLSIGYAACHWCHVMAHESFEDPRIADLLNRYFVAIKVDREERPDLDGIYMSAVVAMTGQGGWPMSIFLLPDGQPFYGGTYFPPTPRYGIPSFSQVLASLAQSWKSDRKQILEVGAKLKSHLQKGTALDLSTQPLQPQALQAATDTLLKGYDWEHGGWGPAPKFPQPMAVEFLLRQATRGNSEAFKAAAHALDSMSRGGMYDVVGGGFHRYSTDQHWLVPHFEKMLYDNAQLALVYLHAWRLTGQPAWRRICEETLDFIQRELTAPEGGFYSSLDADSGGEEGSFYVWTPAELEEAAGSPEDATFLTAAYGIQPGGNFEGRSILQRALTDRQLAEAFDLPEEGVPARLGQLHARLLAVRSPRIRPATDDKVLAAWNAMALQAFAEAGRYLDRRDYLEVAINNASFLLSALHPADRLLRSWRAGSAHHNAYLEDYAALILGLLALYQSDPDLRWYSTAVKLAQDMVASFADPSGGFFDTRADHDPLVIRPRDLQDNATPSGNALAVHALLQLHAYSGEEGWRHAAEELLGGMQSVFLRYPTAFACWLSALDFAIGPVRQVALLGPAGSPALKEMVSALWSDYRPRNLAAISSFPPPPGSPLLLRERPLLDHQPTAYVCEGFVCKLPVSGAVQFKEQLAEGPVVFPG